MHCAQYLDFVSTFHKLKKVIETINFNLLNNLFQLHLMKMRETVPSVWIVKGTAYCVLAIIWLPAMNVQSHCSIEEMDAQYVAKKL